MPQKESSALFGELVFSPLEDHPLTMESFGSAGVDGTCASSRGSWAARESACASENVCEAPEGEAVSLVIISV